MRSITVLARKVSQTNLAATPTKVKHANGRVRPETIRDCYHILAFARSDI